MKRLIQPLDGMANPAIGLSVSDHVDSRVLAANVAEVHTIPTGAKAVNFTATDYFYANFGAAAAVPAGDVIDGTASVPCPGLRTFGSSITTIGLIAPRACVVTMEFFS
jgi:hypothetical protein